MEIGFLGSQAFGASGRHQVVVGSYEDEIGSFP